MEFWKSIEGYEGFYEVSSQGRVRSVDRYVTCGKSTLHLKAKVKKITVRKGYCVVTLNKDGEFKTYYVHRLVATAFLGHPNEKQDVNHKDENKLNNNVNNLEWCSRLYNINYGTRTTRQIKTQSIPVAMLNDKGEIVKIFPSLSSTKSEGYNPSNIKYTCDGKFKKMYGYRWQWA